MNIFRQLTEKPWLTPQPVGGPALPEQGQETRQARLGVRVFLAVVTVLFTLLVVAYGARMAFEDWRPGPEIGLLWLNTLVLVLSSMAMQAASWAAHHNQPGTTRNWFLAGGALAVLFLVGQILAWRQLAAMGQFGMSFPAVAFFYLITGLHALHLAGGLVAWAMTAAHLLAADRAGEVRGVELCTLYWHFLLVVWLVLFGLLFSGNNMSALLVFCGLR